MKKIKLQLNKETIAQLDNEKLGLVYGGGTGMYCVGIESDNTNCPQPMSEVGYNCTPTIACISMPTGPSSAIPATCATCGCPIQVKSFETNCPKGII